LKSQVDQTYDPLLPQPGQSRAERTEFIPLPLDSLRADTVLDCDLYIKIGKEQYIKYSEPGVYFDHDARIKLRENNHEAIYAKDSDAKKFNTYLETNLKESLHNSKLKPEEKAQVLYTTSVHLMRELMLDPTAPEAVRTCRRIAESAVEHISYNPGSLSHIMDLASADYYTYTHSVNVMTYAVSLAVQLGYPQTEALNELGLAALMHDVGKSFIDWKITNKSGPLSLDEFELMKQHPDFGFRALKKTRELPDHALFAIRHHHEKLNGKGYPHGLSGKQIDLNVRIISCADIYDALTTNRVYRGAFPSFPALQIMKEQAGSEIDEKVFKQFVQMLGEV
jgi:HD-GYP domain-containing protein (c-di-GMP phosphodiesterase class II)